MNGKFIFHTGRKKEEVIFYMNGIRHSSNDMKKRFLSPIPKKQGKTWWTNTKQTKIGWKWSKPLLKCSHMYYVHFHKIGSSHFVSLWDSWIRYYEAQTTGSYQWQAGQSKVKPLFIWYLHCVQQTNQIFFFTLKAKISTKYQKWE